MIYRWWLELIRWLAHRYLLHEFDGHHKIVTRTWYPFVVQQVRKAEQTGSHGSAKREFVLAAVRARFQAKEMPCPPLVDLHLAIEYAVRDHAH